MRQLPSMGVPTKTLSISALYSMFLNVLLHILAISAADEISCYGVNEVEYDKQHLCPGSKTCCGIDDQCQQDTRLCSRPNGELVRGPCYGTPDLKYDFENCAQICITSESTSNIARDSLRILTCYKLLDETLSGGLFPRVTNCENGSFCCDYQGKSCCKYGLGVFVQSGLLVNISDVPL